MNDILGWSVDTLEFLQRFEGHTIYVAMQDVGKKTPWHFHDGIRECIKLMDKKNDEENRWGAFFTVNELDETRDEVGKHRTAKMWERSRAIFMDDDLKREEGDYRRDWPTPPSVIVESSPGKFHYYWLISGGEESSCGMVEWQLMQDRLIEKWGGDKQARDVARYLRLPGSFNWKNSAVSEDGEQWVVRWRLGELSGLPYPWHDLVRVFYKGGVEKLQEKVLESESGVVVDEEGRVVEGRLGSEMKQKTNELMVSEIKSGVNYHENLLNLSWQMKQEGLSNFICAEFLRGIMMQVRDELKDERWKERYEDIERVVKNAKKEKGKGHEIDLEELGKIAEEDEKSRAEEVDGEIPWPPGLLGELSMDAYNMAVYPYKEVAVVSAIGLVAGIAGRRFNVSKTGLNTYLTVIMDTGMGKDAIQHFISGTLRGLNELGLSSSFEGRSRFTGPKALRKSFKDARCQVCVLSEAGMLLQSTAGDQAGLTRTFLTIYGKSGSLVWSGSEGYSSDEDDLGSLRAPCMTVVNEATPVTLLAAFDEYNSSERGELPRQTVIRIRGDKPYAKMEKERQETISVGNTNKLVGLIKKCAKTQADDDPKAWDMKWEGDVYQDAMLYERQLTNLYNEARKSGANLRKNMLSRMWLKAAKFAAIAAVYNKNVATIGWEEWNWGKAMVEYELNGVVNIFAHHASADEDELEVLIRECIAGKVLKILNGDLSYGYKRNFKWDQQESKNGIFSASLLQQQTRDDSRLTRWANKNSGKYRIRYKSACYLLLEAMREREYVVVESSRPLKYRLTNQFKLLFAAPGRYPESNQRRKQEAKIRGIQLSS